MLTTRHLQWASLVVVMLGALYAFDASSDYLYSQVFITGAAVASSEPNVSVNVTPALPAAKQPVTFTATATGDVDIVKLYINEDGNSYYETQRECEGRTCSITRTYSAGQKVSYYALGYQRLGSNSRMLVARSLPIKRFAVEGGSGKVVPQVPSPEDSNETVNYSVELAPGWNQIGQNTTTHLVNTDCKKVQVGSVAYAYFTEANEFVTFNTRDDLTADLTLRNQLVSQHPQNINISRAMWVYNRADSCSLGVSSLPESSAVSLPDGWSMLSVPADWEGKKMSEVVDDNCGFSYGYHYDGSDWLTITDDYVFGRDLLGKGFWAYVTDCTLKDFSP